MLTEALLFAFLSVHQAEAAGDLFQNYGLSREVLGSGQRPEASGPVAVWLFPLIKGTSALMRGGGVCVREGF